MRYHIDDAERRRFMEELARSKSKERQPPKKPPEQKYKEPVAIRQRKQETHIGSDDGTEPEETYTPPAKRKLKTTLKVGGKGAAIIGTLLALAGGVRVCQNSETGKGDHDIVKGIIDTGNEISGGCGGFDKEKWDKLVEVYNDYEKLGINLISLKKENLSIEQLRETILERIGEENREFLEQCVEATIKATIDRLLEQGKRGKYTGFKGKTLNLQELRKHFIEHPEDLSNFDPNHLTIFDRATNTNLTVTLYQEAKPKGVEFHEVVNRELLKRQRLEALEPRINIGVSSDTSLSDEVKRKIREFKPLTSISFDLIDENLRTERTRKMIEQLGILFQIPVSENLAGYDRLTEQQKKEYNEKILKVIRLLASAILKYELRQAEILTQNNINSLNEYVKKLKEFGIDLYGYGLKPIPTDASPEEIALLNPFERIGGKKGIANKAQKDETILSLAAELQRILEEAVRRIDSEQEPIDASVEEEPTNDTGTGEKPNQDAGATRTTETAPDLQPTEQEEPNATAEKETSGEFINGNGITLKKHERYFELISADPEKYYFANNGDILKTSEPIILTVEIINKSETENMSLPSYLISMQTLSDKRTGNRKYVLDFARTVKENNLTPDGLIRPGQRVERLFVFELVREEVREEE